MRRRGRAGRMPRGWSFSARVDASPDAVYAWMSDYSEDDHANPRFKAGAGVKPDDRTHNHRVVRRTSERHLTVEDQWGRQRFVVEVELVPERREVRISGQYGYRGVWRAEPDGAGTRVVSEGRLEPTGFARLFAPLFAGMFMKQMRGDFEGHVADMRASLKP